MAKHQPRGSSRLFIETELGIVTRSGEWFHTTTEEIKKFVPGLLESVQLETIIRDARAWVRSANSLGLTLLLVLLFVGNPWLAALTGIAFHWLWYTYKSAFVNTWMGGILSRINSDGYQFIIALAGLSLLGIWGQYTALATGTVFFFIFRLALLDKLWNKLTTDKKLTLNDRVLKMVLLKYAISEDVAPRNVQQMEDRIQEKIANRKTGKN